MLVFEASQRAWEIYSSEAGPRGMDLRTAQLVGANDLARRHLNQRRATEESLSLVLDEDGVIREGGVIRASRGRRAEHDSAGELAVDRAHGEVVE